MERAQSALRGRAANEEQAVSAAFAISATGDCSRRVIRRLKDKPILEVKTLRGSGEGTAE